MQKDATIVKQTIINSFFKQFPSDAALTLESFPNKKILEYFKAMSAEESTEVFSRLNPDIAFELINDMDNSLFVQIFSKIDIPIAARLISQLEKNDIQSKLNHLPQLQAREIREFMFYKPDSAGYLMETAVTTFKPENTVHDVLQRIRKLSGRSITVIYLILDSGELIGKVPIQRIAVSDPGEKLRNLIQDAPSVSAFSTREEVLQILDKSRLLQVPVTDVKGRLLGVIYNEALINATKQDITEDLQAMFGAGRNEQALSKVSFAVKKRLPWLQINLATAFLASLVVGFFEDTIAQITILAVFLPVVAGQSGNTGSQALAVTMRGLALREIGISQWFKVAKKEILVGFINGLAVALTTGIIVYFWASSFGIAIVIAISMVLSMMIAGFSGAGIPIILKSFGQDPATSSSIILTTVTDICGFLSFLGLATVLASVLGIV